MIVANCQLFCLSCHSSVSALNYGITLWLGGRSLPLFTFLGDRVGSSVAGRPGFTRAAVQVSERRLPGVH